MQSPGGHTEELSVSCQLTKDQIPLRYPARELELDSVMEFGLNMATATHICCNDNKHPTFIQIFRFRQHINTNPSLYLRS